MPTAIEAIDHQGLPALRLSTREGARAIVSLFGAQVLSWIPPGGREWLYVSERACFDRSLPIRGGIPVCFPQFAARGPLPKHGFARLRDWTLEDQRAARDYSQVSLSLQATAEEAACWPHAWRAELTVSVAENRLDVELEVANPGSEPFEFTAALHTYLRVDEVETARLEGLYGHEYEDSTEGDTLRRDSGDVLLVDREVDRLYRSVQGALLLRDGDRALGIHGENFPDLVVWNPWEEKCATLADMPRSGFRHMLCVEAAAVAQPVRVEAGDDWWGRKTLVAL
jgi:glucose-6-phosphate 1-epimerase